MKFYGIADFDFDGPDRLRSKFHSSMEDALIEGIDNGSIDVFDGNPPRRVDSYDVHTVELYEVANYLNRRKKDGELQEYHFFTVSDEWGSGEDMLTIVVMV